MHVCRPLACFFFDPILFVFRSDPFGYTKSTDSLYDLLQEFLKGKMMSDFYGEKLWIVYTSL